MMERGLRGKVAALGAAVVLCAGGSLLGSSPQDTAAVVPVPAAGISAVQTRGVKVYVSGAVAKPGLYEIPAGSRATAAIAAARYSSIRCAEYHRPQATLSVRQP